MGRTIGPDNWGKNGFQIEYLFLIFFFESKEVMAKELILPKTKQNPL